jgi:hypothetical protein
MDGQGAGETYQVFEALFRFPRDHILQRHLQRLRQRGQNVRAGFAIPFPIAPGLVFLLPRGWID